MTSLAWAFFSASRLKLSLNLDRIWPVTSVGSAASSGTGARALRVSGPLRPYNPAARGSINVIEGTNAITNRQTNKIASSGIRGRTVSSTCTLPMAQEP
jgi:hypothetical protein